MESNDLFLYDGADILRKLQQTGGMSLIVTSFLTQFMKIPFVGTCMVTVLYLCIAWVIWCILRKQVQGTVMAGLSLLPVAFLYLCLEHDYYRLQGHVAFLLMLLALWGYLSVPRNRLMLRLAVGMVLVPLLYVAAGSVAVAFALTACWVESYHSWSGNSRWMVFSSRRENGLYTQPYIAYMPEDGTSHKPFLLPQRNPKAFYGAQRNAYNIPELVKRKIPYSSRDISDFAHETVAIPLE